MATQYKRFEALLQELELYENYFPVLLENGFDDWEALTYLNEPTLAEIGNYQILSHQPRNQGPQYRPANPHLPQSSSRKCRRSRK